MPSSAERLAVVRAAQRRYYARHKKRIQTRADPRWKQNWYQRNKADQNAKATARRRLRNGIPTPLLTKPAACQCCHRRTTRLVIDHDHRSGRFRGWLCNACNMAIGALDDSINGVQNALRYLLLAELL